MDKKNISTILVFLVLVSLLFPLAPVGAQGGPNANAGADRSTTTGTALTFSGAGSTGDITTYHWNFGDGTSATGVSVTKSFTDTGSFTVTLTVTDTSSATDQDTAQVTVTQDTVAPSISHTNVTSGTPGQQVSIVASLTDNVGVQSGTVFYKNATMGGFQSTSMTQSEGTNDWSANIPSSVVTGSFILYYVRARDTSSNTAGYPSGVLSDTDLSVNVSLADTSAPKITHTQVTNATAGQARTITATITDTGSDVNSATLYYKRATAGSYSSAAMTKDGNTYTGSVPASVVTTSHAHYYIQATDTAGTPNTGRAPQTAPGTPYGICVGDSVLRDTISVTEPTSLSEGSATTLTVSVSAGSAKSLTNVTTWALVDGSWTKIHERTPSSGQKTVSAYAVSVPGTAVTATDLQYYVQVNGTDSNDNARVGFHGCTVAAKTVSVAEETQSSGGGGGGGARRIPTPTDRVEATSETKDGITTATARLTGDAGKSYAIDLGATGGPLRELTLELAETLRDAEVQVTIQQDPPGGKELPSGWANRLYLEIGVPEGAALAGELVFQLQRDDLGDRDPLQVVLLHGAQEWEPLVTITQDPDADPVEFTALIGSFSPFAIVYDEEPPVVELMDPQPDTRVEGPVTIQAKLTDNRGIDQEATKILLDGEHVDVEFEGDMATFTTAQALEAGTHTIEVIAHDLSGHTTSESRGFETVSDEKSGKDGDGKKKTPGPALVVPVLLVLVLLGVARGRNDRRF